MVLTERIDLRTRGNTDMLDLTPEVERCLERAGLINGVVTLFTSSSTSALTTIEYESGALEDLRSALEEIAPVDRDYRHNLRWGDGNGHSHLRAALIGPSLSVPVINGELSLGTWQQILFLDFDVRPRSRTLVLQLMGELA